jgi:hypothetical protein
VGHATVSAGQDRVVGVAAGLLVAAAPLTATVAVLAYLDDGYGAATYDNAVAQGLVGNDTAFAAVGVLIQIGILVVNLTAAAALLGAARSVLAGRNNGRVGAWVLGGYLVLCFGSTAAGSSSSDGIAGVVSAFPTWFEAVFATTTVFLVALLAAVVVLLALPPAAALFRATRHRSGGMHDTEPPTEAAKLLADLGLPDEVRSAASNRLRERNDLLETDDTTSPVAKPAVDDE